MASSSIQVEDLDLDLEVVLAPNGLRLGGQAELANVTHAIGQDQPIRTGRLASDFILSWSDDELTLERLRAVLEDASISVRLAAANYLVHSGNGAETIEAFARGLENDILWARIRAGAHLSYCSRDQLRPMKPLIPVLQAAADNPRFFGPEHDPYIETKQFKRMLDAQRDVIGRRWVLERVKKRIELS